MSLYSKEFDDFIDHLQRPETLKKFRTSWFRKGNLENSQELCYLVSRVEGKYPTLEVSALFQEVGFTEENLQNFLVPYRYSIKATKDDRGRLFFSELEIECRIRESATDDEYNNVTIRTKKPMLAVDVIEYVEIEYNHNYNLLPDEEKTVLLLSGQVPLGKEVIRQLRELSATLNLVSRTVEKSEQKQRNIGMAFGQWIPHWAINGKSAVSIAAGGVFNGIATYYVVRLYFNIALMLFYVL